MAKDYQYLVNPRGNDNYRLEPTPPRTYQVVVAATQDMGIAKDGSIPWMNAVVMGRKTWESIPPECRPLAGCLNVVITRSGGSDIEIAATVFTCASVSSAMKRLAALPYSMIIEKVFLIGGGQIFREALNAPGCEAIHITEIEARIECDTFMPRIDFSVFWPWYSSFPVVENGLRYSFNTYVRVRLSTEEPKGQNHPSPLNFGVKNFSFLPKEIFERHEEYKYRRLVQEIISEGTAKVDGIGLGTATLSKFGYQTRFNLRKSFPLLTTKKLFWRKVVEELLWFMSGSTNAKVLQEKGLWDVNASREYVDSIGLTEREEGDLGPVYGFQLRHAGARYTNMHSTYSGQGFDQLLDVVNKIKHNPDDPNITLSAWNPYEPNMMSFPPCHLSAQFYVANGELSSLMNQQSGEMGLDVPFNIACYALLTCMIAHVCDLVPGDFIHVIGDAYVCSDNVISLQKQLQNLPRPFPILRINPKKKDIDSFVATDFKLMGYLTRRFK